MQQSVPSPSHDELRRLITSGYFERAALFEPEAKYDLQIMTKMRTLSPGAACGPLSPYSRYHRSGATEAERPIVFCNSISEIKIGDVDRLGGIITKIGDVTSHVVLRARAHSVPVACAGANRIENFPESSSSDIVTFIAGAHEALLYRGRAAIPDSQSCELLSAALAVARTLRTTAVLANVDDHLDAVAAFRAGADGISMWRTENFMMAFDGGALLRRALLSVLQSEGYGSSRSVSELQLIVKEEFRKILLAAGAAAVTVRLLDLPLSHMIGSDYPKSLLPSASAALSDSNPLLSVRGARLGIIYNGIAEFQLRALLDALHEVGEISDHTQIRILIPFVTDAAEVRWYRWFTQRLINSHPLAGRWKGFLFGATIETPRGAVTAAELAEVCDFFSIGTNDLTQYTWALDRDSAYAAVIAPYLESNIFKYNPFSNFDYAGVGSLIEECISRGRRANPTLQVGITGHFGSDPGLGQYFDSLGVDYVGCSLDRISGVSFAYAKRQSQEVLGAGGI